MQLLREVVGKGPTLAHLTRSKDYVNPTGFELYAANLKAAARSLGRELVVFDIDAEQDIDSAFTAMAQRRATALVASPDPSLNTRRDQNIELAAHHAIPTMYPNREYALAGGLMSHGVELSDDIVKPASIPDAFSRAPNQRTCQFCSPPNSN